MRALVGERAARSATPIDATVPITASTVARTRGPEAKPSPAAATGSSCTEQHEATTVRSSLPRNSVAHARSKTRERKHRERHHGERTREVERANARVERVDLRQHARDRARRRPSPRASGSPIRSRRTRRTRTSRRARRGSCDRRRAPRGRAPGPARPRRCARTWRRARSASRARAAPRWRAARRSGAAPSAP